MNRNRYDLSHTGSNFEMGHEGEFDYDHGRRPSQFRRYLSQPKITHHRRQLSPRQVAHMINSLQDNSPHILNPYKPGVLFVGKQCRPRSDAAERDF